MGINGWPFYGDADVGSAIQDIEKVITKIKTNKFDKKDIHKLYSANNELIKALLNEN